MSISLYSGTPGSYKSYHAVSDILSWLSWGKNVIANFPVKYDTYFKPKKLAKLGSFNFVRNTDLTVEYLITYAKKHHKAGIKPQTLVVFDEASIKFNARQFDNADRMEWINFFANHRHFNFEVILIAQNDRMLDRQVRGLIEYDYKHRALKNMNFATFLISLVCRGLFRVVELWYPCRQITNVNICRFNIKKARCYDTMALFVGGKDEKKDTAGGESIKTVRKKIERIKINREGGKENDSDSGEVSEAPPDKETA